jgi:hypothetical protein
MWYAKDVRNQILTRLEDVTNGINALLTTIDTERSETTPQAELITYGENQSQFPAVYIDLADSNIESVRGMDVTVMPEVFECQITAEIPGSDLASAKDYAENYIEAILRSLQNYEVLNGDGENFVCLASSVVRELLGNQGGQVMRRVGVEFQVVRNFQY